MARHLSYMRAAEEIYLFQAIVSMQIKKLGSDVGLSLTELIDRKISLTEAGAELYQASRHPRYTGTSGNAD